MARLEIDPALVEEAVYLRIRALEETRAPESREWARERDELYARGDPAERERAFTAHARRWFERLGLDELLRQALQAAPRLAVVAEIRVRRALGARQEGSDLIDEAGETRFELVLAPARFLDPRGLREFVTRECLYADDMLDPAFDYRAELASRSPEEPPRGELVRDRLAVLLEARVLGRVDALLGLAAGRAPTPAFLRAFAGALDERGARELHGRAASGALSKFSELLAAARREPETSTDDRSPAPASPRPRAAPAHTDWSPQ